MPGWFWTEQLVLITLATLQLCQMDERLVRIRKCKLLYNSSSCISGLSKSLQAKTLGLQNLILFLDSSWLSNLCTIRFSPKQFIIIFPCTWENIMSILQLLNQAWLNGHCQLTILN